MPFCDVQKPVCKWYEPAKNILCLCPFRLQASPPSRSPSGQVGFLLLCTYRAWPVLQVLDLTRVRRSLKEAVSANI
jgi:hypothetical protein